MKSYFDLQPLFKLRYGVHWPQVAANAKSILDSFPPNEVWTEDKLWNLMQLAFTMHKAELPKVQPHKPDVAFERFLKQKGLKRHD